MMSSKLAFATILVASYATTAEAAGSCIAKTDNEWAALGLTVDTPAGTDVDALGAFGAAPGWSEDSTGSATAVCVGGAALAALTETLPDITNGVAATYSSVASTSSGSGTGLVADIVVASATALTSITVTTAGSGYSIDDTVTFAASGGEYDEIVYTLKAADFDAFTASGVTEHEKCGAADTCPTSWGAKTSAAATHCAGLSCARDTTDKATCCDENTCTAKADDDAVWAALGVTVTTNDATTVTGLGTIAKAGNYFGTLSVTCPTAGGDFDVSGVTACTSVTNAADPNAVTCTNSTTSQMTGACAAGYTKNTAGTADACDANTCTCTDGTPATGADCDTDNAPKCASCDSGFYLDAMSCTGCATVANAATVTCSSSSDEVAATCNAGFYLDSGNCTQQQACSDDTSSGTCTNSAIKRDSNLCATDTCGGSDFGDTHTACCVECLVNANCSGDYPKCAKAGTADPWTCHSVPDDDATCLAIDADKPTWYTNECGCATGEWAATADAACAAATVCGLDIDGSTQRSATGDANHTFAGTCVACTSGWAATDASDCVSHTNVTTCTGKQADGTARKVAGTATADASCTACADGTAAANWMTDCASTATTTPAPAATTTPAPKTSIDPGTEDSAATATLGVASALAAAAAFARLL